MNKNFASWELTQLLPKENPYLPFVDIYWNKSKKLQFKNYQLDEKLETVTYFQDDYYLRHAWTFEDIRLYLLEKGYELEIITEIDIEGNQRLYYYNIHFLNTLDEEQDDTFYHSYEEAREAGYIYLLETYDKRTEN